MRGAEKPNPDASGPLQIDPRGKNALYVAAISLGFVGTRTIVRPLKQ